MAVSIPVNSSLLSSFQEAKASLNIAIIGASGGIGGALIESIISDSDLNNLYCCSRSLIDLSALQQKNKTMNLHHLSLDIEDELSIATAAQLIAKHEIQLDIVIVTTGLLHNQQGLQPEKALQQLNPDYFLKNMMVNALGPALVAKYFLPLMQKQSRSFFGAFSARVGSISDNGLGGWHSYRASKAALNMLIKNIAIEYKRKYPKLIVAGLHPGTVDTELSAPFQKNLKPDKLFTPEFSAKQLLIVINSLKEEDSGSCFAWDGQPIPA